MANDKGLVGIPGAHPGDRNVSLRACSGLNIHMLSRGDSPEYDFAVLETLSESLVEKRPRALIHVSATTRPLAAKALQEYAPDKAKQLQLARQAESTQARQLVGQLCVLSYSCIKDAHFVTPCELVVALNVLNVHV